MLSVSDSSPSRKDRIRANTHVRNCDKVLDDNNPLLHVALPENHLGHPIGHLVRVQNERLDVRRRLGLALGTVTAIGTAAVLCVGGLQVLDGRLTLGRLLVVLAYLGNLYDPLHMISHTLSMMQSAVIGARRVLEILGREPEDAGREADRQLPPTRGQIEFEDVVFGYRPGIRALDEVSFEVPTGSVIAVVGPTGAGKTTLVGLLLRYFDPQGGRVSAARSAWFRRKAGSFRSASPTTSATGGPRPPISTFAAPRRLPTPTGSSPRSRTVMPRRLPKGGRRSRAVSGNGSPWRGRSSKTRQS